MFILTADQMKTADGYAIHTLGIPGATLMGRAAQGIAETIAEMTPNARRAVLVCGSGNNGGDGLALAGILARGGVSVTVVLSSARALSEDAAYYFNRLPEQVRTLRFTDDSAACLREIAGADIAVDALYGTGFRGSLTGAAAELAAAMNASAASVCSVDIPSGCNCDTGAAEGVAVQADYTVTFSNKKPCHFLYPAAGLCGKIVVKDIGIPTKAVLAANPYICETTDQDIAALLRSRPQNSHKGTFGRLGLVCGSDDMPGAAALAVSAALRSGVGLAELASVPSVVQRVSGRFSEPVYLTLAQAGGRISAEALDALRGLCGRAQALVVGCGLGGGDTVGRTVMALTEAAQCPILIDADGITALNGNIHVIKNRLVETVLTPHPREMARLCGLTVEQVQQDRLGVARTLAKEAGAVVVLKGANTVIALPDGRIRINPAANSGLAKGGSGDVLSGLIGSLLAQGYPAEEAAVIGVYIHGRAGLLAAAELTEYAMQPSDLVSYFSKVFKRIIEQNGE